MSVEITIVRTREREKWQDSLALLPANLRDIYYSAEYCCLHEVQGDGEAQLFIFQNKDDIWIHPFLLREITHVGGEEVPFHCADIQTCYGYGGPLSSTCAPEFINTASVAYVEYCKSLNAVTGFIRFHPLLENQIYLSSGVGSEVHGVRDYVWVDLTTTSKVLFSESYNNVLRADLRKAVNCGFMVETTNDRDAFARFVTLYIGAMQRLTAHNMYFFSAKYFEALWELVSQKGILVVARLGEEIHAAAIFLAMGKYSHYHLAASDDVGRKASAGCLVLDQGIKWARSHGAEKMHLGGGLTNRPDDGLFRFKAKFSPLRARYYIGRQIYDAVSYEWLVKRWDEKHAVEAPKCQHILQRYREP